MSLYILFEIDLDVKYYKFLLITEAIIQQKSFYF